MTLVYRAVLRDADGSITSSVESLFRQWLVEKQLVDDSFVLAPGFQGVLTAEPALTTLARTRSTSRGRPSFDRFRLVEDRDDGQWTTTVVSKPPVPQQESLGLDLQEGPEQLAMTQEVVDGSGPGWVWVDLEHTPVQGRRSMRPGSPRLVRNLMAAGEAYDGSVPLTAEALHVTQAHVPELAGYIRDERRRVPLVVFAHDAQRAYDQERLAGNLARDLAGVASVFVLADPLATQALAARLPDDYAVFAGALRTYLPGATGDADTSTRHRILGRVSISALGNRAFPAVKNQVLQLSTQQPAPVDALTLARSLADLSGLSQALQRRPETTPSRESAGLRWFSAQILRIRRALGVDRPVEPLEDLAAAQSLLAADLDALLDRVQLPVPRPATPDLPPEVTARLTAAETRAAAAEQEQQLLEVLLGAASDEALAASEAVRTLTDDRDYVQLELAEALRDNDKLRRRALWLGSQIAVGGASPDAQQADIAVPESVAEVLLLARERLERVRIGATDVDAAELDIHPGAALYAAKTWDALLALDSYARARASGEFAGSFYAWCQTPPPGGVGISAAAVAMVESETVDTTPALRGRREFSVPVEVSSTGKQYMPAHVKLVRRGTPAPRLHFYDDCAGATGLVHVGYVGEHLPTGKFN